MWRGSPPQCPAFAEFKRRGSFGVDLPEAVRARESGSSLTKKRYTLYAVEKAPRRRWKRIVLWSSVAFVLVVLLTVAGSYVWFRAEVSSANRRVAPEVRSALQEKPSTSLTAAATGSGAADGQEQQYTHPSPSAMNLLVIGSDRRDDDPSLGNRSDTIMIVHVDPDADYLSVLSLPRDLRVKIPGHGRGKLNSAFAYGGAALTIKTIEQTTGVDISHYMEIGFDAFSEMVDSLGGVYVDVDKRYYNPDYHYEPINIFPGYQLLKGTDALDYVRYRHDLNMDFGRMERQQRFMSAVREQAMGWDLPFKLPGLISALFKNVATDLDANQILRLARWGIGLNGANIRGITLKGDTPTIAGAAYVVATEDQMATAVAQLLYKEAPGDSRGTTATTGAGDSGDGSGSGNAGSGTSTPPGMQFPDSYVWKQWAAQTPYAVRAPSHLPKGYEYVRRFPDTYPTYGIAVGGGQKPAFRMMYAAPDNPDQVMGITETTWQDAPVASKGQQVTHGDVVYTVVRNDTKVECVWFKADGVLYFVSNTLSHWLDQDEMLKIAESMTIVPK